MTTKELDDAIYRIQRADTPETITSIYESDDVLECMEKYSADRSFVVGQLIASHKTGEAHVNALLAKIEELTAKRDQLENDCLEEIANRDLAEGQLDRIASTILGEPIGWTFHYSKWCEAEDEATRLTAERNHAKAERDKLQAELAAIKSKIHTLTVDDGY